MMQEGATSPQAVPPTSPLLYRWLRAHGLAGLTPWHFLDNGKRIAALREEYQLEVGGKRDLMPFAERQDMDTIAGFVVEAGVVTDRVATVHLTWIRKAERPGWPGESVEASFLGWLSAVLFTDAAQWMSEEDLADIVVNGTSLAHTVFPSSNR